MRSLLKNKVCKTNPSIELQLENLNSLNLLPTKGADATAAEDDDEIDSEQTRQLVEQGFEVCRCDHAKCEQSGGSHGRRSALREHDTHVDPRCGCERVRP